MENIELEKYPRLLNTIEIYWHDLRTHEDFFHLNGFISGVETTLNAIFPFYQSEEKKIKLKREVRFLKKISDQLLRDA